MDIHSCSHANFSSDLEHPSTTVDTIVGPTVMWCQSYARDHDSLLLGSPYLKFPRSHACCGLGRQGGSQGRAQWASYLALNTSPNLRKFCFRNTPLNRDPCRVRAVVENVPCGVRSKDIKSPTARWEHIPSDYSRTLWDLFELWMQQ